MCLKDTPESLPLLTIKVTLLIQTGRSTIPHIQRMMSIVVCKEPLAAKREQAIHPTEETIQLLEVDLVALSVDRVCLPQASGNDLSHWRAYLETRCFQAIAHQLAQLSEEQGSSAQRTVEFRGPSPLL
jgi:hypothetical protein